MSYPILFNRIEDDYETQGYGFLSDAISCEMTEELNGEYEVVLKYPTTGVHFSDIQNRRILSVKTPYESMSGNTKQLFRIYYISEPLKGAVEIRAAHISYDLSGYPVEPFTVDDLDSAMDGLTYNSLIACPFTLFNGRSENRAKRFTVEEPSTIRSCMMGEEGSILDRYRGEWVFDNFNCYLVDKRGENRGVVLRYGKNLLGLRQETQSDEQYSHILAYARYTLDSGEERVKRGHVITVDDTIRPKQVFLLDMSEAYVESIPTRDELDNYANEYATNNQINELDTTYTIEWVQLPDTKETVTLGDTIKMYYHGAMYTSRVVSYVWDVLKDRYRSIEVGRTKRKFYDVVKKAAKANARRAAEQVVTAYGDAKNLIYNSVKPTLTKRPNILGDVTNGAAPTSSYGNVRYFTLWLENSSNNVTREKVDNGFNIKFTGSYIDSAFLNPRSISGYVLIGCNYDWERVSAVRKSFYVTQGSGELIPSSTSTEGASVYSYPIFTSPNYAYLDDWDKCFEDNYEKVYNWVNATDTDLANAALFIGDSQVDYLSNNYRSTLPFGTYTFSFDVESDFWKNYEVYDSQASIADDLLMQFFPIARVRIVVYKADKQGKIYSGYRRFWSKPNDRLVWKYSERSDLKNKRLSCTFTYDPNSVTETYYNSSFLQKTASSSVYTGIDFQIGLAGYCGTELWTPDITTGTIAVRRTTANESYIKITNLQLESGKKATAYAPGIYDTYRGISSDTINALF